MSMKKDGTWERIKVKNYNQEDRNSLEERPKEIEVLPKESF